MESERKTCFKSIRSAIEDSNIDQRFKDIALYDLNQAEISYERRAFKASIVMFGAVVEGLMLGVIREDNTALTDMIKDPKAAPTDVRKLGLHQFSKPEDLANKISNELGFESYKKIIFHLKPEIKKLGLERIQNLRNTVHPWESIKQPQIFRDPGPKIAINCLSSLALLAEKILD